MPAPLDSPPFVESGGPIRSRSDVRASSESDNGIAPPPARDAATGSTLVGVARAAHTRWREYRRQRASERHQQRLSLDWTRVNLLVGFTVCAAIAATVLGEWAATAHRAQSAAEHGLAFAEGRLNDVETEMRRVADAAHEDRDWARCSSSLSNALTRSSIASSLVRRFVLSSESIDGACRPEGPGATPFFPYEPTENVAVTSTGEIALQLTAALRHDSAGRIVSAVLDPRAFTIDESDGSAWGDHSDIRLSLLSADGRRLVSLGGPEVSRPTIAALQTTVASALRGVRVRADVDRDALTRELITSGVAAALLSGGLILGLVALCWRQVVRRARLFHRIQRGLKKREFVPFVQPIIDLRSGRCTGGEVLMRWEHPHRGVLPPSEFIDEAERTGLIGAMSELIMTRAAHQLAPLAREYPELRFAFNLTPQQLIDARLPGRLADIFREDTLPPERVLLEITEREFVDPAAADNLRALHHDGWRVAVDDFGTGHSSLSVLEQLPIDRLKIDRSFVNTISEETVNRPVLEAIIQLADRLQLPTIAEGIETHAQLEYLAARGVQFGQGFLIGRPMSLTAFREWLARHNAGTPSRVAAQATASMPSNEPPDKVAQRLWNAMRVPGGLDIRDRIFRLRSYPNCFVGREAVDWMVQHDNVTRAEAVRHGQRLIALGLMTHVVDEHDFEDAELFYRLATPVTANLTPSGVPAILRSQLQARAGIDLTGHARGLIRHGECVTGSALVRFMMTSHSTTRAIARQWALQLMREGVVRHVYDDQPFRDDRTLYRVM